MHVAINEKGLLSKVMLRLEYKWELPLWVGRFWEFLLFPDAVVVPITGRSTGSGSAVPGSSPEPTQGTACIPPSYISSSRYLLSALNLHLGVARRNIPETNIMGVTQRAIGNHLSAPFSNGVVGHWGVVATSESQATPSLSCLVPLVCCSPAALP